MSASSLPTGFRRPVLLPLSFAVALSATAHAKTTTHANPFIHQGTTQTVKASGTIQLGEMEPFETVRNEDGGEQTGTGDAGTLHQGLSVQLDSVMGYGGVDGQAQQTWSAAPNRISFSGLVDVSAYGSVYDFDGQYWGHGYTETTLSHRFELEEGHGMRLTMNSTVADYRDDDFAFSLSRLQDGEWQAVWTNTVIFDDVAMYRDFSVPLFLSAGQYRMDMTLRASAYIDGTIGGSYGYSGRTLADVTLSPAPEPETVLMAVVGLGMVLALRRKGRADGTVSVQNRP